MASSALSEGPRRDRLFVDGDGKLTDYGYAVLRVLFKSLGITGNLEDSMALQADDIATLQQAPDGLASLHDNVNELRRVVEGLQQGYQL